MLKGLSVFVLVICVSAARTIFLSQLEYRVQWHLKSSLSWPSTICMAIINNNCESTREEAYTMLILFWKSSWKMIKYKIVGTALNKKVAWKKYNNLADTTIDNQNSTIKPHSELVIYFLDCLTWKENRFQLDKACNFDLWSVTVHKSTENINGLILCTVI